MRGYVDVVIVVVVVVVDSIICRCVFIAVQEQYSGPAVGVAPIIFNAAAAAVVAVVAEATIVAAPAAAILKNIFVTFSLFFQIHNSFVLTAAHCVHSYEADSFTVSVGEQNSVRSDEHEREVDAKHMHFPNIF